MGSALPAGALPIEQVLPRARPSRLRAAGNRNACLVRSVVCSRRKTKKQCVGHATSSPTAGWLCHSRVPEVRGGLGRPRQWRARRLWASRRHHAARGHDCTAWRVAFPPSRAKRGGEEQRGGSCPGVWGRGNRLSHACVPRQLDVDSEVLAHAPGPALKRTTPQLHASLAALSQRNGILQVHVQPRAVQNRALRSPDIVRSFRPQVVGNIVIHG